MVDLNWVLLCLLVLIPNVLSNDCSSSNINNNLQQCLDSIWNRAKDKDAFWFGTNWISICGFNPFQSPYCTSLKRPYTPHSLLNTIYGLDGNFTKNPLKQFLHVEYTSQPGMYQSCGNTYTMNQKSVFSLEPLGSTIHYPWNVRSRPSITWTADQSKYYTLFIYDAGAYISHGVFINIQGNDIENSDIMRQYSSPKNPTIKEQVYAFLLFEQTDNITISDEMRVKLSQYMVGVAYNYTDVFTELQLQGPIAMNMITVVADPYSIQFMVNGGVLNECPTLVTEALKTKQLSFIPNDVSLSVTLNIDLHTPAISFLSCCKQYSNSEKTTRLNPIGDGYISPGNARTEGTLTMSMLKRGLLYMPTGKTDDLYTLLCVDISVPNPAAGTRDLPLLHMLSININGSIESGDTVRYFRGPAPPDNNNHTYIFLLYTQVSSLVKNETETSYLTKGCSANLENRCLFNISRFVDGAGLTLVGASWFLATNDEYVRYTYLSRGQDADSVCANIPGYDNPCPVGSGAQLKCEMLVILLLICSIFMMRV